MLLLESINFGIFQYEKLFCFFAPKVAILKLPEVPYI